MSVEIQWGLQRGNLEADELGVAFRVEFECPVMMLLLSKPPG